MADGYDFQILRNTDYLSAEGKGVKAEVGSIRMTKTEFEKAREYESDYFLVVVNTLAEVQKSKRANGHKSIRQKEEKFNVQHLTLNVQR